MAPDPADLARGIDRIIEIASEVRTAIMCSESAPLSKHKQPRANCHRVGMLAPMLRSGTPPVSQVAAKAYAKRLHARMSIGDAATGFWSP